MTILETQKRDIDRLRTQIESVSMPAMLRFKKIDALRILLSPVDTVESDVWARQVISEGTDGLKSGELDGSEPKEALLLLKRNYVHLGPRDFHSYLMALEWEREARLQFYTPRMSVMRPVVDELTNLMVHDKLDILGFSMPPGVGKSTLGLFFLTWVIGRDPMKPNLASGYSDKITRSFYTGVLGVATDSDYTYREIYPYLELIATNAKDETLDFRDDGRQVVKRFTSLTCRSIGGSLTGATRCEGVLYCDDLVSGIEEALVFERMEGLWAEYGLDLKTRKKKHCKELHIGTRWSLHDPIGRLETLNENNPRAKFIKLPAVDDAGHSHFDYLHDVGFDDKYFAEMRETTDDVSWLCVYMQEPIEREGILFPEDALKRFMALPPEHEEPDERYGFVDVAFGGEDALSMPIIYRYGEDHFVADWVFMAKADYDVTEPVVAGAIIAHKLQRVKFEANNGGDFYARDVQELLKGENYHCLITSERAPNDKSKMGRIVQHSPAIKEFHFCDREHYPSDDYRRAIQQTVTFTYKTKKGDDAPDSLAGLATMSRFKMNATVGTASRREVGL